MGKLPVVLALTASLASSVDVQDGWRELGLSEAQIEYETSEIERSHGLTPPSTPTRSSSSWYSRRTPLDELVAQPYQWNSVPVRAHFRGDTPNKFRGDMSLSQDISNLAKAIEDKTPGWLFTPTISRNDLDRWYNDVNIILGRCRNASINDRAERNRAKDAATRLQQACSGIRAVRNYSSGLIMDAMREMRQCAF